MVRKMKVKVPLVLAFTLMKTVRKEFGENLSHKMSRQSASFNLMFLSCTVPTGATYVRQTA